MNLLHKNSIVICHKKVEKNNFLCFVNLSYLIEMCSLDRQDFGNQHGSKSI